MPRRNYDMLTAGGLVSIVLAGLATGVVWGYHLAPWVIGVCVGLITGGWAVTYWNLRRTQVQWERTDRMLVRVVDEAMRQRSQS